MVNKIIGALLERRTSGLQDYYAGTLKSACEVCPKSTRPARTSTG